MNTKLSAMLCSLAVVLCSAGCTKMNTDEADVLPEETVKSAALNHAGITEDRVTFTEVRLEKEDGKTYYEIGFYGSGIDYEYEIDAFSGKVLVFDQDQETSVTQNIENVEDIGEEQAKQIAQGKVPGADIEQIYVEKDSEDGKPIYEGNFIHEGKEYEFEIDALSGTVIKWDEEVLE